MLYGRKKSICGLKKGSVHTAKTSFEAVATRSFIVQNKK